MNSSDNCKKDKGKKNRIPKAIGLMGILCIIYCITIFFVGFGTKFFLIWGILGIGCLGVSLLQIKCHFWTKLPKWLRMIMTCAVCMALIVFVIAEGLICTQFHAKPRPGADYCIILGAQWKKNGPSEVLRRRLDQAVRYLTDNPETKVIVSGGQGNNEIISEAEGMKQYLCNAGISADRIETEDQSVNTTQNLQFSAEFLDLKTDRVVIVTNNFHMYRALKLAEKQGYQAEGLAASSLPILLPNNMLREFLGVMKDFLMGNL